MNKTQGLTRFLGWFSIGLGAAELLAPDRVASLIGLDGESDRTWMRIMGAREIGVGLGILAQPRPVRWVQARIAGDALDTALLTRALRSGGTDNARVLGALGAVSGVALLDAYTADRLARDGAEGEELGWRTRALDLSRSITIQTEPEELYRFWRELSNLPRFMEHLESVEDLGGGRSRWRAHGPAGLQATWTAEIIEERPGECIAWQSLPGSMVDNEGSVRFARAPGDRGTEVRVRLRYRPPAGRVGAAFARLFGEAAGQQVYDDLRGLKQIMELGEVVRSDASIHRRPHPAQPPQRHFEPKLERMPKGAR